jgi:replicative DNA helicase
MGIKMNKIETLFDEEMEKSLLGAFIIAPENLLMSTAKPEMFSSKQNAELFRALRRMSDKKEEIDISSLYSDLVSHGVTGWTKMALHDLTLSCGSSMHWQTYEDRLRELYSRRQVVTASSALYADALDIEKPLEETVSHIIDQISKTTGISESAVHISDWLDDFEEDLIARAMGERIPGLKTGFSNLDDIIGGLEPKTMMMVMGIPAVGKSMFTMQIGLQMAAWYPGVIYSLEMQGRSVIRRMISGMGKINSGSLKEGRMTAEEKARYDQTIQMIGKRKLYISDYADWNLATLRAELTKQKVMNGIRWFVLDYMYLMSDELQEDETRRTTTISTGLKKICSDLGLVGIIVHSLNKGGLEDNVIPSMKHVRGSGQVVYNADIIVGLSEVPRDMSGLESLSESQRKNIRALFILKGREIQNPKQYTLFTKNPDYPVFSEFEQRGGTD